MSRYVTNVICVGSDVGKCQNQHSQMCQQNDGENKEIMTSLVSLPEIKRVGENAPPPTSDNTDTKQFYTDDCTFQNEWTTKG